ncbi:lysophospholipid acyltransferase family protein [Meridianimarinicoccus sp. RP-17]|uniref:lysophospholipid acyltransferase family protein n=1 Tax=Meridianimarinicoccus zhengii TaxID=2056810 RepID=UPI000DADC823|nr:DUF374 domain-containing protein [Phycocomes zhengii]
MNRLQRRWRDFEIRVQKSTRVQNVLRRLFSAYVNFAFRTIRWERIGFESYEADIARGIPRVLCCWHERLIFTPYLRDWTDHRLTVMASGHADARIASANLVERGIGLIELETSGNKAGALREAVMALRAGGSVGITVDGPFGPARKAKPGALVVAGLAGVQAAPCTYAVSRSIRLGTWDRFVVPLPWSRGVLAVGDGITPPRRMTDAESDAACARLGALIDDLTARCESRLRKD